LITKLPRWIEFGAFALAFIAGCINSIGLLGFEHQAVSHVSGTATLLGAGLVFADQGVVWHLAGVVLSFFVGACFSGWLLHGASLRLGRHYDTALVIEALLLFAALLLLSNASSVGHFAASAACGLQNALATAYSGAVVRTTHLTGIVTDLGIMLGAFLRGESFDRRKGILFALILMGFVCGAASGTWLFGKLEFNSLWLPAIACLLLAVMYRIHIKRAQRSR